MQTALRIKFPDHQRKYREFSFGHGRLWGRVATEKDLSSLGFHRNSLISRTGNYFRGTGNYFDGTGNPLSRTGNLSNPKRPYNRPSLNKTKRRAPTHSSVIGVRRP